MADGDAGAEQGLVRPFIVVLGGLALVALAFVAALVGVLSAPYVGPGAYASVRLVLLGSGVCLAASLLVVMGTAAGRVGRPRVGRRGAALVALALATAGFAVAAVIFAATWLAWEMHDREWVVALTLGSLGLAWVCLPLAMAARRMLRPALRFADTP